MPRWRSWSTTRMSVRLCAKPAERVPKRRPEAATPMSTLLARFLKLLCMCSVLPVNEKLVVSLVGSAAAVLFRAPPLSMGLLKTLTKYRLWSFTVACQGALPVSGTLQLLMRPCKTGPCEFPARAAGPPHSACRYADRPRRSGRLLALAAHAHGETEY